MNAYLQDCLLQTGAAYVPNSGAVVCDRDAMPLARKLNAIVPVSLYASDGVILASCFPVLHRAVDSFLTEYRGNLFSGEALDALHRLLTPQLLAWGYRPSAFPHQYGLAFLCDREERVPESLLLPGVRRLTEEDRGLSGRVTMKLADCIRRPSYGMVRDGELLAVAAVNSSGGSLLCTEIGVECTPAYRKQGFAKACTAGLTRYLCRERKTVLYRSYKTNTASCRTAEAAGFTLCGQFFTYTAFRK